MHRSSVRPVGTIGRHQTSCPLAAKVNGLVRMTRSGGPNWSAKAHLLGSANLTGGGRSAGLPRGAPLSTQRAIVWICSLAEPEVVLQLLDADVAVVPIRRHLARQHLLLDRAGPGTHLLVGRERHRSDRAGLVALLTVLLEDGGDVSCKRDGRGVGARLLSHGRGPRYENGKERQPSCLSAYPHARGDPTEEGGRHTGTSPTRFYREEGFRGSAGLLQFVPNAYSACVVRT